MDIIKHLRDSQPGCVCKARATPLQKLAKQTQRCSQELQDVQSRWLTRCVWSSLQFQDTDYTHTITVLCTRLLTVGASVLFVLFNFVRCPCNVFDMIIIIITRGQSNLTKSASRGANSRLGVTPGGRKLYQ